MWVGAAIAAAVAGVAKGVAALLAGIGNADDPLGTKTALFPAADLFAQTADGKVIGGEFSYNEDGAYLVDFQVKRLD